MLTKSVNSVISVVLKHVTKKIRAIGAIREHNIRIVLPDGKSFLSVIIRQSTNA